MLAYVLQVIHELHISSFVQPRIKYLLTISYYPQIRKMDSKCFSFTTPVSVCTMTCALDNAFINQQYCVNLNAAKGCSLNFLQLSGYAIKFLNSTNALPKLAKDSL